MNIRLKAVLLVAGLILNAGDPGGQCFASDGNGASAPWIVGGSEVAASEPIAASTVLLTDGKFICSASLLSEDILVSAAHCMTSRNLTAIFTTDISKLDSENLSALSRPISALEVSPSWRGSRSSGVDQGDIAVAGFSGGLPEGYEPAQLMDDSSKLVSGEEVVLAGFGVTSPGDSSSAGVLRKTEVTLSDPKFGQTEVLLDQSQGSGACHGDSGGPAFIQSGRGLELWGVTNRAYPETAPDDCARGVIYTRIDAYGDWIRSAVEQIRRTTSTN